MGLRLRSCFSFRVGGWVKRSERRPKERTKTCTRRELHRQWTPPGTGLAAAVRCGLITKHTLTAYFSGTMGLGIF